MDAGGTGLSAPAKKALRRRLRLDEDADAGDVDGALPRGGAARPPQQSYNDSRFVFVAAFEKLALALTVAEAACALACFALPHEAPALAGGLGGSAPGRGLALPALRLLEGAAWYAGYLLWAASVVDAVLWASDAVEHAAQRRALAAARSVDPSAGRGLAIPWWHDSWALWGLRAADAAVVAAHGAMLLLLPRRGALFRLVTLGRVLLRGAGLGRLLEGELDDRTRRAMDVVVRHRDRADQLASRAATLESSWRAEVAAREAAEEAVAELEEAAATSREEADTLQEALLVAAADVARMERILAHTGRGGSGSGAATPASVPSSPRQRASSLATTTTTTTARHLTREPQAGIGGIDSGAGAGAVSAQLAPRPVVDPPQLLPSYQQLVTLPPAATSRPSSRGSAGARSVAGDSSGGGCSTQPLWGAYQVQAPHPAPARSRGASPTPAAAPAEVTAADVFARAAVSTPAVASPATAGEGDCGCDTVTAGASIPTTSSGGESPSAHRSSPSPSQAPLSPGAVSDVSSADDAAGDINTGAYVLASGRAEGGAGGAGSSDRGHGEDAADTGAGAEGDGDDEDDDSDPIGAAITAIDGVRRSLSVASGSPTQQLQSYGGSPPAVTAAATAEGRREA